MRRTFLLALCLLLAGLALAPAAPARITKPRWIRGVLITEYFPVPERWFVGRKVRAAGLRTKHRVDWLFSGRGLPMEGSGTGLDGRGYYFAAEGRAGWVTKDGKHTSARNGFSGGPPYWLSVGWRNRNGRVTFPLEKGGWSRGLPKRKLPNRGVRFAKGKPKPLTFWRSLAVDPSFIPMGSRIYIPAYKSKPGGGWFRAADTGGAINGRHVDVYRPAPSKPGSGNVRRGQRIYVIPRKRH